MPIALEPVYEKTQEFFRRLGGSVSSILAATTTTYAVPDRAILCLNYYISFANASLFGEGDYAGEVYPRYRQMRSDWKRFLCDSGIDIANEVAIGFVPLLGDTQDTGTPYPKASETPLGIRIAPISEADPSYYQRMRDDLGVRYCLMEQGGVRVGPEEGMLLSLAALAKSLGCIDKLVDIAAGTGELSAYALRRCGTQRVTVNEFSPYLSEHLQRYIGRVAEENGAIAGFQFVDCREMILPDAADVISVGVFYGVQPSLMLEQGKQIVKTLGEEGILVVQSSMPETLFNHHMLLGDEPRLISWPWYSGEMTLPHYFSSCSTIHLANQFITFASQSPKTIDGVLNMLQRRAVPFKDVYKTVK